MNLKGDLTPLKPTQISFSGSVKCQKSLVLLCLHHLCVTFHNTKIQTMKKILNFNLRNLQPIDRMCAPTVTSWKKSNTFTTSADKTTQRTASWYFHHHCVCFPPLGRSVSRFSNDWRHWYDSAYIPVPLESCKPIEKLVLCLSVIMKTWTAVRDCFRSQSLHVLHTHSAF